MVVSAQMSQTFPLARTRQINRERPAARLTISSVSGVSSHSPEILEAGVSPSTRSIIRVHSPRLLFNSIQSLPVLSVSTHFKNLLISRLSAFQLLPSSRVDSMVRGHQIRRGPCNNRPNILTLHYSFNFMKICGRRHYWGNPMSRGAAVFVREEADAAHSGRKTNHLIAA